jgi:hypothetical protein
VKVRERDDRDRFAAVLPKSVFLLPSPPTKCCGLQDREEKIVGRNRFQHSKRHIGATSLVIGWSCRRLHPYSRNGGVVFFHA